MAKTRPDKNYSGDGFPGVGSGGHPLRDRRSVLTGMTGFALLGLTNCTPAPPDISRVQQAQGTSFPIDVHAHVFNASDLPVGGFVRRVVFEDFEDPYCFAQARRSVFGGVGRALVDLLSRRSLTAAQELARLNGARVETTSESDVDILKSVLAGAQERARSTRTGSPESPRESNDALARDPGAEDFLDDLRRETGQTAMARSLDGMTDQDLGRLAEGALAARGTISNTLRWGLLLLKPRRQIIGEYLKLYGRTDGVRLFTPFLVDFDYWLDDRPRSSLADQIVLMDRLQRWVAEESGARMHTMVPFCPWRELATGEAMPMVEDAVMNRGFVGVKLYPPMGFYPWGNQNGTVCYPERAQAHDRFPQRIDEALRRLYEWCSEHEVPIITHTNDSQGAGDAFARRAHPRFWEPVITRYPKLRINMGHFGDFQEAFRNPPGKPWEFTVGEMMEREDVARVYSDLSYLESVFSREFPARRKRDLAAQLSAFYTNYPNAANRLLFGTDWIMVGRESDHETYIPALTSHFQSTGRSMEDFRKLLHHNAVDYLGLSQGRKNRQRLEAYYGKHGLDRSWLDQWSV